MARSEYQIRQWVLAAAAVAVVGAVLEQTRVTADPPPSTRPADSVGRSLLSQLDDETRRAYARDRASVVRVQLPTPAWLEQINAQQQVLRKWWPLLDPEVREKLIEQEEHRRADALRQSGASPTTQSTSQPSFVAATQPTGEMILPPLIVTTNGIVVDPAGHLVLPLYLDPKAVGDAPLRAMTAEGVMTTARFIGSDPRTFLTVLQLKDSVPPPATLSDRTPDDGMLTILMTADGGCRLTVWTRGRPDTGLAFSTDDTVAGFGAENHFLSAARAKPVIDQLISTGHVHRPVLGVVISPIAKDDPARQQNPSLAARPALRIGAVQEKSPAAYAGLQADDVILSIANEPVTDTHDFAAVIANQHGQTTLTILRRSKTIEITVLLPGN